MGPAGDQKVQSLESEAISDRPLEQPELKGSMKDNSPKFATAVANATSPA